MKAKLQRWIDVVLLAAGVVALAAPRAAFAQPRLSAGLGAAVAGSTDASLSEGRTAAFAMAQATTTVAPFVGLGVEVDYWRSGALHVAFATGHAQLHVPSTSLLLRLGVGAGNGDPDGRGSITGAAIQLGAAYDFRFPASPLALTLFGNASLAHAASRSLQMVGGGLALTWW